MTDQTKAIVPETLEGWTILHEIFRVDWAGWKKVPLDQKQRSLSDGKAFLEKISKPIEGQSAFFSLLGHKGDLLFLHFRKTFDELNEVELGFRQLALADYLFETTSYVSFVELGLYEMTAKLFDDLMSKGLKPSSEEWEACWKNEMKEQRERMKGRLYPSIPPDRYLCFYPMNKRRGETVNWYVRSMEERQRMMRDHGMIGRKYTGQVTQIISGSIASDDWEWGVDLFAKDPLVFKKLIYEMRFDEASALYAQFGPFYTGLRLEPSQLTGFFSGKSPPTL